MMDKIKEILKLIFYILPIVLLGIVMRLLGQNRDLAGQLRTEKTKKELGDILAKKENAKTEADAKEADYRAKRDAYLNSITPKGPGPNV